MIVRLIAIVAVVINIAVLAGCSSAPPDQSAATTTAGTEPRPSVALVTHQPPGDAFWDVVRKGAQAAADRDGIDLQYLHDPDPTAQARLVTDAVERKVAGIAVTLADPPALTPAVRTATAAGIPVVALNTGIQAWAPLGILSYFGQDDAVAGRAAGTRLTQEGAHNILCVIQTAGHIGLAARCDGAAQTFTGSLQRLQVDGTRPADVKAAVVARLQQDRGIDRVLTLGAAVALTALQAVGEANSYARVVTFDTNPAVIEAIKSGTVKWAIDQQPYLQGYLAVDALSLYLTNKNIVGGGLPTLTGPSFVDESNVDSVAERAEQGTR
jgi:simple sugar transport system substrate-binding protein